MEFFPGFTSIEILRHIQQYLNARRINPDQHEGRIIFMPMFNDIDWTEEILMCVSRMPEKLVTTTMSFSEGIGHSLVLEMKEKKREPATTSQKENGTSNPITWLMYSDRVVIQYSGA